MDPPSEEPVVTEALCNSQQLPRETDDFDLWASGQSLICELRLCNWHSQLNSKNPMIGFLVFASILGVVAWYLCRGVGRKRNTGTQHGGGIDSAPTGIDTL